MILMNIGTFDHPSLRKVGPGLFLGRGSEGVTNTHPSRKNRREYFPQGKMVFIPPRGGWFDTCFFVSNREVSFKIYPCQTPLPLSKYAECTPLKGRFSADGRTSSWGSFALHSFMRRNGGVPMCRNWKIFYSSLSSPQSFGLSHLYLY